MSRYALPDLRYDFSALEPHISARVLQLHHGTHHAAYVTGANEAIELLFEARHTGAMNQIGELERKLAFNVSGHVLHSIYWQNLAPGAGGDPDGDLLATIARDFGSFERFRKQMVQTAMTIMGSGWAALVWDPLLKRLGTSQIHDHQSEITQGSVPLLVIDVWEHAFYLQHQANKARYLDAIWHLVDWDDVADRLLRARALDLGLMGAAQDPAPVLLDDELRRPQHP